MAGCLRRISFSVPARRSRSTGNCLQEGRSRSRGPSEEAHDIAESEQVARYLKRYRQVLVTNYRDFELIGRDADGSAVKLEKYRLAPSEKAFWEAARHPFKMAEEHGERFTEYLARVMLHAATIAAPKDVAWFLADHIARDAKARSSAKARA